MRMRTGAKKDANDEAVFDFRVGPTRIRMGIF